MRGKAAAGGNAGIYPGITPAYAGKSTDYECSQESKKDHPRLCGEKEIAKATGKSQQGSPPPMRGKD